MDQANSDVKAVLYAFLGRRKMIPEYSLRPTGPKHHQRFFCEVRVKGYDYVGAGNSTTKKDAQGNAAKDFIQYLLRIGEMKPEDLPKTGDVFPNIKMENDKSSSFAEAITPSIPGFTPVELGEAYRPLPGSSRFSQENNFREQNVSDVADAESLDVNSAIHGSWTIENAKSKLHQFLQENRITADYRYTSIGPDHNNKISPSSSLKSKFCCAVPFVNRKALKLPGRSFVAEMSFYVQQLKREIGAREAGSNKQIASKSCALSLVRQLFHLNVIGPFTGTLKRNPEKDLIKPFSVVVSKAIEQELDDVIRCMNLDCRLNDGENSTVPRVLLEERLAPKAMRLDVDSDASLSNQGVVTWAPPTPNWNPWTACNIDEGFLASASLDALSLDLRQRYEHRIQYDESLRKLMKQRECLPIFSVKNQIMEAIFENPVIIIRGNTGCGKTTQVCQYILDDYLRSDQGAHCSVIVTQPRRISATSVADRVAAERGEEIGETIGYSVRFENCLPRPYGSVLFCTVGVLLRRLESGLRGISHVIVDEIHERDVNTDFLLVVLRDIVYRHPELRIILMSATIDTSLFSRYFGNCPVVEVPGNSYPVQIHFLEDCVELLNFRPTPDPRKNKNRKDDDCEKDEENDNMNLIVYGNYSPETKRAMALLSEKDISFELIEALLHHIKRIGIPGAVLIFLPGWNVIFTLLKYLQQSRLASSGEYCFLPLHSMLPREDQRRVFQPVPAHVSKVILATNIAETSITIDDVVFVIDSCRAKMKLFTSHNNMTHYATVWAAQSNLEQRRGRAGRVRPGFAYHLCSRARFEKLEKHLTAEMLRSPLHETALAIKLLRLGSISHFLSKALEPPPIDSVIEAEVTLREMKCLDDNEELTPLGQLVARLPVEPSLAKMLIVGTIFHHGDAMCVLAASDSIKAEVFYHGADQARLTFRQRSFAGERHSDHVALLSAFYAYEDVRLNQGSYAEMSFCETQSLSLSTLRIVFDARNQLRDLLISFGFPEVALVPQVYRTCGDDPSLDTVLGLLSIGHYPNVCIHKEKRKVLTTESRAALIHKSSVNCASKFRDVQFPLPFFVFSEKIRTRAVSCKTMSNVTPLHLILFGCKKVQVLQENDASPHLVRLDNWITLQIDPRAVAKILALRPALDRLIFDVSSNPDMVANLGPSSSPLIRIIERLCHLKAADFRQASHEEGTHQGPSMAQPLIGRGAKRPHEGETRVRYDQGFSNRGAYNRGSFYHSGVTSFNQGYDVSIGPPHSGAFYGGQPQNYGYHRAWQPRRGSYGSRGHGHNRGYDRGYGYQPPAY